MGVFRVRTVFVCVVFTALIVSGCAGTTSTSGDLVGGIKGIVTLAETGMPVEGAHVYAYEDYSKNLVGVADQVSRGSAPDGSYIIELQPGTYYLVARKRASGSNYGPIVTGDLYDHRFEQKSVKIKNSKYVEMNFELGELSEPLFFQVFTERARKTETGIKGKLIDEEGSPVHGAFATAYRDSNMMRLPDFASTLSDDEGNYTLYLPSGGHWFIGARSHARGVPEKGELVGRHMDRSDHSVLVPDKEFVEGINITLRPFTSKVPSGYNPY
jgi:hypothetical protein